MQINISDIWSDDVKKTHKDFFEDVISRAFPHRNPLMAKLLFEHGSALATSQPATLRTIVQFTEKAKAAYHQDIRDEFNEACKGLFDYGRFAQKSTNGWNAYTLCSTSTYTMCPYCQQSFAVTIYRDKKSKALRPTLDHFYPKHKYPYLGLSLYNLIPSCHPCNSSLKSTENFYEKEHLHPYEDSEALHYNIDLKAYIAHRELGLRTPAPEVTINELPDTHPLCKKVQNSIETFVAKERLSISRPELKRFVDALITYNPSRLDEINHTILSGSRWVLTPESVLNFSRPNYKNEWLGAIKRDLYDLSWGRSG